MNLIDGIAGKLRKLYVEKFTNPNENKFKTFSYNVFEKTLLIYYKWICLENRSTYLTVIMSFLLWDADGGNFHLTT